MPLDKKELEKLVHEQLKDFPMPLPNFEKGLVEFILPLLDKAREEGKEEMKNEFKEGG